MGVGLVERPGPQTRHDGVVGSMAIAPLVFRDRVILRGRCPISDASVACALKRSAGFAGRINELAARHFNRWFLPSRFALVLCVCESRDR